MPATKLTPIQPTMTLVNNPYRMVCAREAMEMLGIKSYASFYAMKPDKLFAARVIGKKQVKYSVKAIQDYLS